MRESRKGILVLCVRLLLFLIILSSGCTTVPSGDVPSDRPDRTEMPAGTQVQGTVVVRDTPTGSSFPVNTISYQNLTGESNTLYPSIGTQLTSSGHGKRTDFSFNFQKDTYKISIPVNGSVYEGAKTATKVLRGSWEDEDYISGYYQAFSNDPAQEELYKSISSKLEEIRSKKGLNDDWYLRLMVAFVQQIPYDENAAAEPRFPVEVIYDGKGDCDEKSLLLIGMMQRSGYDVALLAFPQEKHMAAAIRVQVTNPEKISSFPIFSGSHGKYTYIETTGLDYIGNCADIYKIANRDRRVRIISLTKGGKAFSGINYESQALSALQRSREVIDYYDNIVKTRGWLANPEIDKYNACVRVFNYVSTHAYDMDGALWYIDNNHIMDSDFLGY